MENLLQRFENLKNLLTQRASSALGEALLDAFLSSLSDYETAVVKNLTATGKQLSDLREENDLLRSLVGISDPAVLAKIISQGEELRFLREQITALKKELDANRQQQDTLRLENKALESDLENVHRLRDEEQAKFKAALDAVKEQLKTIGQKTFEKQQQLSKDKDELAKRYAARERDMFIKAEDELRSVAVKLRALTVAAAQAAGSCRSSVEAALEAPVPQVELPPPPKKRKFSFRKKEPAPAAPPPPPMPNPALALIRDITPFIDATGELERVIENYLKILDWGGPEFVKVSWPRFQSEIKKRIADLPRRPGVRVNWPNEKTIPPFISDEKMLVEIAAALVRNSLEAIADEGVVDISITMSPGYLVLQVLDNGPGVNLQDIDKVFLPFYTTKTGHAGIGLARARKLARALGGALSCEPKGIGVLFTLRVPGESPAAVKKIPGAGK